MARTHYLPPVQVEARPVTIADAVVCYCVIAFSLTMSHPVFRALTYAIPPMVLIALLAAGRYTLPPHLAPFAVLIVSGFAYAPIVPLVGWQDLYLMLIGLAPFFFTWRWRFEWRPIFLVAVAVTIISLALTRVVGGGGGGVEFDAMNSKSSFESPTSFVFGLLAVWAALEKRWGRVLLALVLCVLTLKRIVVLGAMLAIVVVILPRRLVSLLLRPLPMLLLNAAYLMLIVSYTQGHLDGLIFHLTGQSANQLGMGRQAAYARPVAELLHDPIQSFFAGVGPGGVYDLMKGGWHFLAKGNLHNDSLKILVEYGGIVWIAFFSAMYLYEDVRVRIVMMFYNVVLLTDNTLIYTYVIFVLGVVLARLRDPTPQPSAQARPGRPRSPPWVRDTEPRAASDDRRIV